MYISGKELLASSKLDSANLSVKIISYGQFMIVAFAELYATYATQFLLKMCKVFIFVQYVLFEKKNE